MEMISREYLLKAFSAFNDTEHAPEGWMNAMKTAKEIVEDAPGVEIGRVGRWISHDRNTGNTKCRTLLYCLPTCSVCGYCADYTNFCPNCGAYMERGVN